jgi:hypothetical protein
VHTCIRGPKPQTIIQTGEGARIVQIALKLRL